MTTLLRRLDRFQRGNRPVGFGYGVIRSYLDDRGSKLAALIGYYGFFSFFPLLLALVTVLGFLLEGDPGLRQDFIDSALGQFPVIGAQLQQPNGLTGNVTGLVVGFGAAIWAGLAAMLATQFAMNEVWAVPVDDRPGFVSARLRALAMLGVLGGGLVASVVVGALASVTPNIPGAGRLGLYLGAVAIDVAIVAGCYRVLTARPQTWRGVLPGALLAGGGVFGLHLLGTWLIDRVLADASDTYGQFALVIGMLTWFSLIAQVIVIGAEVNYVADSGLWPRSLPGADATEADIRAADTVDHARTRANVRAARQQG